MKTFLLILSLLLATAITANAQDEPAKDGSKIQARMQEYIQKRLGLSKSESEKFSPVFVRYFREFVQTHRENRQDKLILQQKIIDLRVRYRTEFRQILNEDRANKVYKYEDEFRKEAIQIIKENRRERMPARKNGSVKIE